MVDHGWAPVGGTHDGVQQGAPGAGLPGPPGPGGGPPWSPPPAGRRTSGWVAVVAVAAVLVAALVVGAVLLAGGSDDGDDGGAGDERAEVVALVTAPGDLVSALRNERSVAVVGLVGMDDTVELPLEDDAAARQQTDAAVAEFEAALTGADEAVYREALAALDGLAALRDEIDGRTQPPGPSEVAYAEQVHARYSEIVSALLDGSARVVLGIDDPELRRGAELVDTASRQVEAAGQLSNALMADPSAWGTSQWVTDVSALRAQLDQGRATVMETATGPYAGAANRLDAELDAAGLLAHVDQALSTGQPNVSELIPSLEATLDTWHTFLADVEHTLSRAG